MSRKEEEEEEKQEEEEEKQKEEEEVWKMDQNPALVTKYRMAVCSERRGPCDCPTVTTGPLAWATETDYDFLFSGSDWSDCSGLSDVDMTPYDLENETHTV